MDYRFFNQLLLSGGARKIPAIIVLGAVVAWCCSCSAKDRSFETSYYLVDHVASAEGVEPGERPLRVPWIEIGFELEPALFQHPPSTYRFSDVPTGEGAFFSVGTAMNPKVWAKETDGVGFRIRCRSTEAEWVELFTTDISPTEHKEDRAWNRQEIPLSFCSTPHTSLELQTTCGPASNCRWDWAIWGNPRIFQQARIRPQFRRLALLISIDTLRPDRMSLYGADRSTTPELEKLAADGVVFETAVAPAPWTIPSHASLLTSTAPQLHAATSQRDIHPELPLVSQVLQEEGWTTAGWVDTPWLGKFGFDRGYDHYDAESPPPGSSRRGIEVTGGRLLDWLEGAEGDVFVFWHIMDVHGPYGAPAPFGGRYRAGLDTFPNGRLEELEKLAYHDYLQLGRFRSFEDLVAAYDEGIAHVDAGIGRLLELLRRTGLYEDALIVVTSDHGESLFDHGVWVGHGLFLTEDEIRVPLVVKLPGNKYAGTRIREMVRLIDVAPTLLDVLGVSAPQTFGGKSLVRPYPGASGALPRAAFGMSSNTGARFVRRNGEKLITPWEIPRANVISTHLRPQQPTSLLAGIESGAKLYDLTSDPQEKKNLHATEVGRQRFEELRKLLRQRTVWLQRLRARISNSQGDAELTPEETRRLKALGYLGGSDK